MTVIVGNSVGCFGILGLASRYNGIFFPLNGDVFRTICHISGNILRYELWRGVCDSHTCYFAHSSPILFCDVASPVMISLDCKKIFDNDEWGREYKIDAIDNSIVVHFVKKQNNKINYEFFLGFHGCSFDFIKKWRELTCEFDAKRNSPPNSRWVFDFGIAQDSFVMCCGSSKKEVVRHTRHAWKNRVALKKESEHTAICKASAPDQAVQCSIWSLSILKHGKGLYAGLPWFVQHWARDELISAKGILLCKENTIAKNIVLHWLHQLLPTAKLPGTMTSFIADSGWVFLRCEDLLPHFSTNEIALVKRKLKEYLDGIVTQIVDGLVVCGARETWMDSIDRSGARIEINALVLAACRLHRKLGSTHPIEEKLKKQVRKTFIHDNIVWDGSEDPTIRPNVFIAAYAYPELISNKDWIKIFDNILPQLWCDWGGLTSINRTDSRFVSKHTGENPASYHNGDSWYWVNNLCAIVLARLDRKHYAKYIDHIWNASRKDILELGAIGHHSEVSSANVQTASGCLAQSWSAALFLELSSELSKN